MLDDGKRHYYISPILHDIIDDIAVNVMRKVDIFEMFEIGLDPEKMIEIYDGWESRDFADHVIKRPKVYKRQSRLFIHRLIGCRRELSS